MVYGDIQIEYRFLFGSRDNQDCICDPMIPRWCRYNTINQNISFVLLICSPGNHYNYWQRKSLFVVRACFNTNPIIRKSTIHKKGNFRKRSIIKEKHLWQCPFRWRIQIYEIPTLWQFPIHGNSNYITNPIFLMSVFC